MNKFLNQNNTQIQELNKQLDKLGQYLRLRNELIGVLCSIQSAETMFIDIQ
jgi:hypothetical protein